MIRRLLLTGFMAAGLVAGPISAAPVAAASHTHAQPVSIVSTMQMADFNYGTFQTSASRVTCRSGTVLDTAYNFIGVEWISATDAVVRLDVNKTFTCPGGAQIFVLLQAQTYYHDPENNNYIPTAETFTWSVLGGTGRFTNLHGQGMGITSFQAVDGQLLSATNYYWGLLDS